PIATGLPPEQIANGGKQYAQLLLGNGLAPRAAAAAQGLALLAPNGTGGRCRRRAQAMSSEHQEVRMVFDAPPGRDMPTLVEIEAHGGRAINIGEWRARPDGYWELVIPIRQG